MYPRLSLALLLAAALLGCSTEPRYNVAGQVPGFDRARLLAVVDQAAHSDRNLHSLLVERFGRLSAELYRNGWNTSLSDGSVFSLWSSLGPQTIHDVRSTTKSVMALVAGGVLARHPDYSLRSRVRDFPELAAKAPPDVQNLELHDFLGMSSGLAWKEWGEGLLTSDETRLFSDKDPVGYALNRRLEYPPGTHFNYSEGSTFIASRMLELIDGRPITEIVRTDLFLPLGIVDLKWGKGANGYPLPYAGLGLRSGDMLKLGELMLARGRWQGRQVIPAEWVDAVTSPLVKVETNFFDLDDQGTSYGFFWWNGTYDGQGVKTRWYSTVGNGGQKIFVVPALELIVVMTGGDYGQPEIQIWETGLLKKLLAAVTL